MSEIKRYITALVLVAALMVLLEYGGVVLFSLLILIVSLISLAELRNLFKEVDTDLSLFPLLFGGAVTGYAFYSGRGWLVPVIYFLFLILVSVVTILFFKSPLGSLSSIVFFMFSLIYVTLPMGCLINMRKEEDGLSYVYILLIATWASDTGAYLTGKRFGRNKLAPLVSPNKTVEGLAGGILLTIVSFLIWWGIGIISWWEAVIFGTVISLSATAGDLVESIIKRAVRVKDSGKIFPGHGGILDRIDALLFTAPVWYICIILIK